MRHRHQSAYGSSEALHPLHASLMSLDALLQLSQSPWLANPEKMIHLALQYTQIPQDLSFKLRHLFTSMWPIRMRREDS
jgi:hypothetical protein